MDSSANTLTRVLLVDDDEDDYLIVRNLLDKARLDLFKLEWVASVSEARTAIEARNHDLYLIDYRLGADDGLALLAPFNIQERSEPFIILTGAGDERLEQKAMKMGIADYLVKGSFNAELLIRVLRYSLQRKYLEQQRIQHFMDINRSKDEFISLASHQLRTPATAVKQYVGMVLQGFTGELTESQKGMLTTAYESNERQLKIVDDLLQVARMDAGRVRLHMALTDVVALVEASFQDQLSKFTERQQKVTCEKCKDQVYVQGDELKLRMVFDNLIDNASKYSEPGKAIKIVVSKTQTDVKIAFIDNGVGINPADTNKLFRKFSRVHNALSTEVGGSGLGLYWAKQIIDLHKGTITVTSKPSKGSTFTVTLPKTANRNTKSKTAYTKF